jgi:tRNA A37 threonylcarbamoyladenosine dehydratase
MLNQFSRTRMLLGPEAMERLAECRVAVFGVGGVGGYAVEALARSGIGALDLIDDDRVCLSNLNRQLHATYGTIGQYKVDAAEQRIRDINPDCRVRTHKTFFLPETEGQFDFTQYDYVVDAIDTVKGKLALAEKAQEAGTPIISAMGAGNKLDPAALEVEDIYRTSVCPLARVMRSECRKRGIRKLKVVYSREVPLRPGKDSGADSREEDSCPPEARKGAARRDIPGSTAFVPAAAGLIIAGEVVKDLVMDLLPRPD